MEQYRLLAECLLPAHMLDWFDLQNVCVEKKDSTQLIHIYLDENGLKPDSMEDLRPNGFTRESVFHDFPIRGHEVLNAKIQHFRAQLRGIVDKKFFLFRLTKIYD